jgi:hypothetical protein
VAYAKRAIKAAIRLLHQAGVTSGQEAAILSLCMLYANSMSKMHSTWILPRILCIDLNANEEHHSFQIFD